MSPPRIGRSAAAAALVLAVAACGDATSKTGEKRESAPVPSARPKPEPAPKDAYPNDAPPKDAAPAAPAPAPPPQDDPNATMPKPSSTGDPPIAPAAPLTGHREFEDAVSARLKTVDEQITKLADKLKAATEDQRAALQKAFDDVSAKRDDAATKLDELRGLAADKWDTAKADLEKAVSALETAATDALK